MATFVADLGVRRPTGRTRAAEARVRPAAFLLVLAAAVAPYIASLWYGFVYDDNVQILGTPIVRSWSFVPSYLFKPVPIFAARYYRPLFFLWLRLNYFLWHTRPWGWHLTSVLLHITATFLVLALLRRYFTNAWGALIGALIFAVHPAHVETVAWVSGCTDTLIAIGLLGALLLWIKCRETPSIRLRLCSFACCALALLSKETGVILPVLIWVHAFGPYFDGARNQRSANRFTYALVQAAPYAVLTACYLAVRHLVLRGVPGSREWISRTQAILTIPSLLLFYVRHSIWPVATSLFYDFSIVSRVSSPFFWVPLIVLAGIAAAIWVWFQRSRDSRILLASVWFMLPIIPVLYVRPFHADDFCHDRYLYLSVIGLSIFAGLLSELLQKYEEQRERPWLSLALFAALVFSLALATAIQARPWKNDLSLYRNAIQVAPENASGWNDLASTYLLNDNQDEATNILTHFLKDAPTNSIAWNNLASEYISEGRYDQAADVLKKLLKDHPKMWMANYNYGLVNYRIGNFILADEYLHRAIQIDQKDPDQFIYLGTTYFKEGRFQDAVRQLREGIVREPDGWGYHSALALALMNQGDLAEARRELLTELDYHPDNNVARGILQQLDKQPGRPASSSALTQQGSTKAP